MRYKPNSPFSAILTTNALGSGSVNADSTPIAVVYRNESLDVAVTPNVTNIGTGKYRIKFTIPPSYAVADNVELHVSTFVGGVAGTKVMQFQIDTAYESDTYARIGSNGSALTALGDARLANLDAANSASGTRAATAILATPTNKLATDSTGRVTVGAIGATAVQAIWEVLLTTVFVTGSIGAKLKSFFVGLGTDNKVLVSSDNHTSGVTVKGVTDAVNTNANPTETSIAASVANLASQSSLDDVADDVITILDKVEDINGGNGDYAVSITVKDTSGTPIPGARVSLLNTGLSLSTGTNGKVTFHVESDDYIVRIGSDYRFELVADTPLDDLSTDMSVDIEVIPTITPLPTIPAGKVALVFDTGDWGEPLANVAVTLRVVTRQRTFKFLQRFDAFQPMTLKTDVNGRAIFVIPPSSSLPREGTELMKYNIVSEKDPFVNKTFVMPDSNASVYDL